MRKLLQAYLADESGATAIEYGIIAALVGLGMIAGLNALGGDNGGAWIDLSDDVKEAMKEK